MIKIEILPLDSIAPDLLAEVREQDSKIFTEPIENAPTWATPSYKVILWEGEQWVCVIDVFERTIQVGNKSVKVGGVGGVMTLPEHRGKGYASRAMQRINTFFCEEMKVEFGLLVCNAKLINFYSQLGWKQTSSSTKTSHEQENGKFALPDDIYAMIYPCSATTWPKGDIDLYGYPW